MSPAQDPDSSSNQDDLPADVSRSDEHAEQWDALAKILGTSDPQEIVSRARALQQSVTALDDRLEDSSSAEMEAAIQDMREQLEHLRKQDADRSDRSDLAGLDAQAELHPKTEVLLDQLEASSLSEAQERIRSLTEQVDHLYSEKEALAEAGLMSSQEALDEITRLQRERDRLRAQQREGEETSPPALSSSQREEIAEVLGIDSVEEARELDDTVRRLSNQLDTLLEEKEALDDTLGVATADDILDLVQSLEGQLSTFYDEQSRARSSDTPVSPKIEEILGISSLEEAEELVSYVHEMNDRLEQLAGEHQTLVANGLDAETAVALIDSMEDQLVDLYEMVDVSGEGIQEETRLSSISPLSSPSETHEESAGDILGISTPSEARELDQMVRQMGVELDRLRSETRSLSEAGLTAEDALQMIDNMEDQLSALYDARDERAEINEALDALEAVLGVERPADAAPPEAISGLCQQVQDLLRDSFEDDRTSLWDTDDLKTTVRARVRELRDERDAYADRSDRLSTLEDILGVSTPEEARDLASLVENIDAQLQALYAEREKLRELGLASVEDAIDMIRSMEHQLQELYQDQEALQGQPHPDPAGQQDTFEQLESLYKEQEKLKRALGVSGADDVIEMVEDLTVQLDEVYAEGDTPSSSPDSPISSDENEPATASSAEVQLTLNSMRHQLEMLYEERQALLRRGIEGAEEATERIDELQDRLQVLQQKHSSCQEQLDQLEAEVGTADASEIRQMLEAGSTESAWDSADSSAVFSLPESKVADDDPFVDAAPTLLDENMLDRLGTLTRDDLDALPVGVLRLDDEGRIQDLNEKGWSFPGLDEFPDHDSLVGTHLFEHVPSTSNALFLGRFKKGVEQDEMDARFPYTFVPSGEQPIVFFIHLYRAGTRQENWLLFRPA